MVASASAEGRDLCLAPVALNFLTETVKKISGASANASRSYLFSGRSFLCGRGTLSLWVQKFAVED